MVNKTKVVLMGMMILFFFSFNVYAAGYKLKWGAVSDATGYKIRYGTSAGNYPTTKDVGNVTEYDLANFSLSEGSTYYFVVRAYNQCGESGDSDYTTHIVVPAADTTPPLNPQNVSAALQGTGIQVSWQAVSAQDLSKYKVYYGLQTRLYGPAVPAAGNLTTCPISGLEAGKKYYVAVSAVDTSDNESGYSPEATIDIPVVVVVDSAPAITITAPVSSGSYTSQASGVTVTGTATDDKGISQVKWSNSLGGNGNATGKTSWNTGTISLMEGANIINVTVYDTAAKTASSSIQVIYQAPDTQKPVVALTYPTTGTAYTTTQTSVNLSGTATDNKGVNKVTWSNSKTGESGTGTGTSNWSISNMTLVSGANPITIIAHDLAGNQASMTLSVTCNAGAAAVEIDTVKPAIALVSPTTGTAYTTTQTSVNVSGTATDNKGINKVTWSNSKTGESGSGTGTSNWSISNMTLVSGANAITITAHDLTGNQASVALNVTCNLSAVSEKGERDTIKPVESGTGTVKPVESDTIKPTVTLVSPTTDTAYKTTQTSVNLSGTATDNKGVSKVTWLNSKTGESGTGTGTSSWSISNVPLASEANLIVITAHDLSGNQASVTLSVTYNKPDTEKPAVALSSPTAGTTFTTDQASVSLSGTATDNKGINKVIWSNSKTGGSGAATTGGTATWSINNIILMEGANPIAISAYDDAGNVGTYAIVVTHQSAVDTISPSISLGFPVTGTSYSSAVTPITLAGSASDNVGVSRVTWTNSAGGSGAATGTSSWTIENISLQEGSNVIVVTAQDAAGNTTAHTLAVTYTVPDTQKPVVSLLSPTTGTTYDTGSEMITLSGTARDNVGVIRIGWTNTNGSFGTATGTTSWSVNNIGLQVGLNTIIITAYDAADNKSVHSLTVNYTVAAPVAIETPPTETQTPPVITPAPAPAPAPETTVNQTKTKEVNSGTTQKRKNTVTSRFLRLFGIGL